MASVALLFSLAGTGIAAQRYLITSMSQIAQHVRVKLEVPAKMVRGYPLTVPAGQDGCAVAACPDGSDAVAGGFEVKPGGIVLQSRPIHFFDRSLQHGGGQSFIGGYFYNAWRIKVMNPAAQSIKIVPWMSCRRIS